MQTYKFKFYHDPGHEWIAVKRDLINALGIADKISGYSYQNGDTVYLEGDCDGSLFCDTLDKKEIKFELVYVYQNKTPIRNYKSYIAS